MRHDPREIRLLGHRDHLGDGGLEADRVVRLVSDVARVDTAELSGDPRELDELRGLRVAPGRIERAGREPEGSLLHPGPDEGAHPVELRGVRCSVRHPEHLSPDGAVRYELRGVHPDPVAEEDLALCGEVDGAAAVRVDEDGGDPLREERDGLACLRIRESLPAVRMRVDEAGREVEPLEIQLDGARRAGRDPPYASIRSPWIPMSAAAGAAPEPSRTSARRRRMS